MEVQHKYIFNFEIPYWKDKKFVLTLCKLFNEKNYIYRFGIFKFKRFDTEDKEVSKWGTNWWKCFDIKKGEIG